MACLLAGPALAEDLPWLGLWSAPDCETPMLLGSAERRLEGETCAITAIVALGGTGAYALRLDCGGEVDDMVVMHDREGDRIWTWSDANQARPVPRRRCGE